jgi:hypothetical protein
MLTANYKYVGLFFIFFWQFKVAKQHIYFKKTWRISEAGSAKPRLTEPSRARPRSGEKIMSSVPGIYHLSKFTPTPLISRLNPLSPTSPSSPL